MKTLIFIFLITLLSTNVNATGQVPDVLTWKGDTLWLFSNPLHSHPNWSELWVAVGMELENKYDSLRLAENHQDEEYELSFSTACNRGYVAHYEIRNDSLFLTNIFACHNRHVKINLKDLFPEKYNDGKVFAHWVAGELYVPKGKCILYVHLGYLSVFEEEKVLDFQNGLLINQRYYQNHIAKEAKWAENPNSYMEFIYKNINWQDLPALNGRRFIVHVGIQPDENGQIFHIIPKSTYLDQYGLDCSNVMVDYDQTNPFIKEAIRIAYLAPEWDVIYQRGKILAVGITVVFTEETKNYYPN